MMSLGTKLTCYLLLGVLVVMGLDLYLSVKRIQTDLLHDVRREVAAMSRTLHLALTLIDRTDSPGPVFYVLRRQPESTLRTCLMWCSMTTRPRSWRARPRSRSTSSQK